MATKTFVSYRYSDHTLVGTIKSFFQPYNGPIQGDVVFCERQEEPLTLPEIRTAILVAMHQCEAALFVIADNNHNSRWVVYEAEAAIGKGLPIVVTRAPGTTGAPPPSLANRPEIRWSARELAQVLNPLGARR
jgi:hypothetical protein